jgi:release factor glutamine methyltransferase
MTGQKLFEGYKKILSGKLGEGETHSIFRIVWEDFYRKKWSRESLNNPISQEEYSKGIFLADFLQNDIPVQYLVENALFYGLNFYVNPSVLIPRSETEELVQWILEDSQNFPIWEKHKEISLLDIGTGSGCIAVALAKNKPNWKVEAMDIDENALRIASKNANSNGVTIKTIPLDILAQNLESSYDIIVSNPPYIPVSDAKRVGDNVISNEPHLALFTPTEDGLIFYSYIINRALKMRRPHFIYFETHDLLANEVLKLLEDAGYGSLEVRKDMAGKDRMVRGAFLMG